MKLNLSKEIYINEVNEVILEVISMEHKYLWKVMILAIGQLETRFGNSQKTFILK